MRQPQRRRPLLLWSLHGLEHQRTHALTEQVAEGRERDEQCLMALERALNDLERERHAHGPRAR
jgi:hypothetical protein